MFKDKYLGGKTTKKSKRNKNLGQKLLPGESIKEYTWQIASNVLVMSCLQTLGGKYRDIYFTIILTLQVSLTCFV